MASNLLQPTKVPLNSACGAMSFTVRQRHSKAIEASHQVWCPDCSVLGVKNGGAFGVVYMSYGMERMRDGGYQLGMAE